MIRWVELSDIFCSKNTIILYTHWLSIRIMQQRFQNSPYHMMDPTHFHSTELGKILQLMSDPKSDILGLFGFFRLNKFTKMASFNVFLDGRAKRSKQNVPQKV